MKASYELGQAIRTRRTDIGLTPQALADLAGLSCSTIIEIEKGAIHDLSLSRAAALLEVLGLGLHITPAHPRLDRLTQATDPLDLAARTASVSYKAALPPRFLSEAFRTGHVPTGYAPHLGALLEEAPLSMLAKAVEQVHVNSAVPRQQLWANMRKMAIELKVFRQIWSAASRSPSA
jgi:transcriptional regulator with XRE-family HTH domain